MHDFFTIINSFSRIEKILTWFNWNFQYLSTCKTRDHCDCRNPWMHLSVSQRISECLMNRYPKNNSMRTSESARVLCVHSTRRHIRLLRAACRHRLPRSRPSQPLFRYAKGLLYQHDNSINLFLALYHKHFGKPRIARHSRFSTARTDWIFSRWNSQFLPTIENRKALYRSDEKREKKWMCTFMRIRVLHK